MAGASLGTAYVQIVPKAQGIEGAITKELGGEAESAGISLGGKLGAFAKKALITAGIGTAVVKTLKDSIAQGAALEQNMGGAVAVFGKSLYGALEKNATSAYKNMGLSMSDYYATANKMGSLFQGSGISQQKSLELTTNAMQRAADVASVMGLDMSAAMESIAGAAKGNFTMMDNLGVAMNATTLEAYALEKGLNFKWNTASNAEKAELAMQMFMDRTAQYAGNYAHEADDTFSGSLESLQASWKNFLGSLALGENVGQMMSALAQSASTFLFNNLIPMIGKVVKSLPAAILSFLKTGLPLLVSGVTTMITNLATSVGNLANSTTGTKVSEWLTAAIPRIVVAGAQLIGKLASTLIANIPKIALAVGKIGAAIVKGLGASLWAKITSCANGIKDRLIAPIDTAKQKISDIVGKIKGFFPINIKNLLSKISIPHISLPHFKLTGEFSLKNKTVPKLSVDWYKTGGIVDSATVFGGIGMGEAGAEAILPLDPFWSRLDRWMESAEQAQGGITNNFYITGNDPKAIAEEVEKIFISKVNRRRLAWQ